MEQRKRITFAIISHPDAGKTTLTEKLLLYGGVIQLAGTIKGRKSKIHTTSDWMELEKQRGISVTTSVMQFDYDNCTINLLDTPGHADFSEDTYRTLTAVDVALMVIDAAKGVEARTVKLLEVCRLRHIPIVTFINKFDRDAKNTLALLDEIEQTLKIRCTPITWPMGMGKYFQGIYHLGERSLYRYEPGKGDKMRDETVIAVPHLADLSSHLSDVDHSLYEELALAEQLYQDFTQEDYLAGKITPVYAGSAVNNFGIKQLLRDFVRIAPDAQPRITQSRLVMPTEAAFTGFVFKIQANMDPQHRDRIAFLRICSGRYQPGIKLYHCRLQKTFTINQAVTFMAGNRELTQAAYAGDIIGLHNHGTLQIGDTFTEGESLQFKGIPHFAPEFFQRVRTKEALKQKKLQKGLQQLCEEGATQLFFPLNNQDLILGAVGALQLEVVAYRLLHEYHVDCVYETLTIATARWVHSEDKKKMEQFIKEHSQHMAKDNNGYWVYLAPSEVNLRFIQERWPMIQFVTTCEHQ